MSAEQVTNIKKYIHDKWDTDVLEVMSEYIKIENQSPHFDADFATNGLQEEAMQLLLDWVKKQPVKGMTTTLLEEEGKTPFLLIEVEGTTATEKTLLMYGHMDKQPPMLPWAEGLEPYTPVLRGEKLYGRAAADDGYAVMASVMSLVALQQEGIPHARTCIIIEGCEESGSYELMHYVDQVKTRLGDVDLVICLDSGALAYDRLWLTTSLRGVVLATVTVETMSEGIHSGIGGGAVADTFNILRELLDRVEDSATGEIKIKEMHCAIPAQVVDNMGAINELGQEFNKQFPTLPGVRCEDENTLELALKNYWKPSLSVVGADGLPPTATAGNVLRASTSVKLSMRMPPNVDCAVAIEALKKELLRDAPRGAKVTITATGSASGWAAPDIHPWLLESLTKGSNEFFGKPAAMMGQGGTIPFMGMLGGMFPAAQFVITGVLGPESNAHGPNEFLHLGFGKGINYVMTQVVADHYKQQVKQ